MPRAARRLYARLGRRGTALLLLGSGKILYGLGLLLTDAPDPRGLELLTSIADLRCWSVVWIGCGAVTFGCAWLKVGRDGAGFIAALGPPFVWSVAFAWSTVTGHYTRGWATLGMYLTSHIGMILWAASQPEHSVPNRPRREGRGG